MPMSRQMQAAIDAGYEPDPPPGARCQNCPHTRRCHEPYGGCRQCECPTFWEMT